MIDLSKYTDTYERKARLQPALICLFPIMIGISISYPAVFSTFTGLVVLAAAVGLLQLLSNLARDQGKAIEAGLYDKWDGMPSVTIFRHRDNKIPKPAKEKYHVIMSSKSEIAGPSTEEESEEPNKADEIYVSWSDYLRGSTRDQDKFNLLFKENINYGFRRNLLGIKRYCIISAIIAIALLLIPVLKGGEVSNIITATTILLVVYILVFLVIIKDSWVKVVADAYAKQLIESINV